MAFLDWFYKILLENCKGCLTGVEAQLHCVFCFPWTSHMSKRCHTACEVTNQSWHHTEIALLSQSHSVQISNFCNWDHVAKDSGQLRCHFFLFHHHHIRNYWHSDCQNSNNIGRSSIWVLFVHCCFNLSTIL